MTDRRRLMFSSRDLHRRGMATLVASWEAYAGGSAGAAVIRSPGLAAAVFPSGPARAVYNNALFARDLGPAERAAALDAAEAVYAAAGVGRYAAWVHESDEALRRDLTARGYTLERARRRGLGTALTALLAHDAAARGCLTASLQSTEMAERVYTTIGFRDLGRILEYVPG